MNLGEKIAYMKSKYCLSMFFWKTVNVYLLYHPLSVPSLSLISSNLPRLNYHCYFCINDHFGLGCWWKPEKQLCVRE